MAKETKKTEEIKEKKCDCGPDCKCGCQEGKECTCGDKGCSCHHGSCSCGCNGGCCPCKRVLGKVLFLALVFFAGMGVNQFMNDTCLGGCPAKRGMRQMPMMQAPRMQGNLPFYKDGNGNTIVIVNTGEEGSHGCKCGPDCKCKHHFKKGFHKHFGENPQVNEPEEAPAQPME